MELANFPQGLPDSNTVYAQNGNIHPENVYAILNAIYNNLRLIPNLIQQQMQSVQAQSSEAIAPNADDSLFSSEFQPYSQTPLENSGINLSTTNANNVYNYGTEGVKYIPGNGIVFTPSANGEVEVKLNAGDIGGGHANAWNEMIGIKFK